MAGRGIADVPSTRKYRPSLAPEGEFETDAESASEDTTRVRGLRRAKMPNVDLQRQARDLANRLDQEDDVPETLASSRSMRLVRDRVAAAIWMMIRFITFDVRCFTVVLDEWRFTAEELLALDPKLILKSFQATLYRNGAAAASGWLIAFIHVDWDPDSQLYQVHLHGLVARGMLDVLERVRQRARKYRSRRPNRQRQGPVYQRVQIKRKPPYSLPAPITYLLKSYYPMVVRYSDEQGRSRRRRLKGRMPEPFHSIALIWLDRQRLQDLTLMVKLSVTRRGLTPRTGPAIRNPIRKEK